VSRLRFAGVATLAGVLIAGGVIYRAYGSTTPVHETASDRSTSRKGGSIGRAVPVIVAQAEARDFVIRRRTIGILESPAIVVVGSRIDSQVLAQHIVDGQLVRQGDLLFTLDDREIQALIARDQAQLAKDNAALTQAEADLGRKQELLAKNFAPQQQVDQAISAYKAAQA
jgi:multidrug efflux system membrane fusion protein